MRTFLIDLAHAGRLLRREPGLALAALATLALGIGFTTTMFSVVHGGTRPLPVHDPDRIVVLSEAGQLDGADISVRPYTYQQWTRSLTSFDQLAAFRPDSVNVSGGTAPDRLSAAAITPNTLALLETRVARGRPFADEDAAPGAAPVAIISDVLWRTRFGADPDVIGAEIRLDGVSHTIVGVMPPRFGFPINARLWTPLDVDADARPGEGVPFQVFGRLTQTVPANQAAEELRVEMARLAAAVPAAYANRAGRLIGFTELETPATMARGLQLLVLGVSLAFLVACANVANLLLARAASRSREIALRTALGASRARLIGQQVAETTLLAGLATAIGLAMAAVGLRFFATASADILDAYWVDFRIDGTVVGFAAALGLLAALAAGLVPALRASSGGPNAVLRAQTAAIAGLRVGRLGRALVVAQIALACGLFVLTTTFAGAWTAVHSVDLVFPARSILTTTLSVSSAVMDDVGARSRFLRALHTRLASAPALARTAIVSALPGRGAGNTQFAFADRPSNSPGLLTGVVMTTPELFELARARATRGRLLTWQDDERALPVAVANESFVRRFSADREVVGQRVRLGTREFTVVGVVTDLLMQDVADRDASGLYLSMLQARPYTVRTMTATAGDPLAVAAAFRAVAAEVDPDLPVLEPSSLFDAIYADKKILDAMAALFLAFGIGTVLLAFVGLFALLSFMVTERTREFGVRVALGATSRDIASLVVARGARELAWGLGLGLAIAVALSRGLAASLEAAPVAGPGAFAAIVVAVAVGALFAMLRPLRRALRLSPIAALRES